MKIALPVTVISAAMIFLVITTLQSGEALEYFKHVDEVMIDPAAWKNRALKLHGNVISGSILKQTHSLDFRFALFRGQHWIEVDYHGVVPDTFKDCAELIVQGQLVNAPSKSNHWKFKAISLSAKCPSKYDGKRSVGCGETLLPQVLASRQ